VSKVPLLVIDRLRKRFGALLVTDHVSMALEAGCVHALIGPNGAGKTTLLAQLSGELRPDAGRIIFDGEDITTVPAPRRTMRGIGRTFQINASFRSFTARENVLIAVLARHKSQPWRRFRGDAEAEAQAEDILRLIGLTAQADQRAGVLPHGALRQLEVGMALAARPSLLLLDEPLAGMAAGEAASMLNLLRDLPRRCAMLLVEHDMDAVFSLAQTITVLSEGRVIAVGTPDDIRHSPEVRQAYLGQVA